MADTTIPPFDRALGMLEDQNGVTRTAATTKVTTTPLIGKAATFIVQTYRQRDEHDEGARSRDTIFLQYLDNETSYRIVIPAEVADVIARQRDALSTKSRKRAGREQAEKRKAEGKTPAFLKVRTA
jgi:hypothetical protein